MDTITISKTEYDDLLEYKKIYEEIENELFYREAKRLSKLVEEGKMETIPAEEVFRKNGLL